MPKDILKVAKKELSRLEKIPTHSPEYTVTRTYLDWLIELPWSKQSKDNENYCIQHGQFSNVKYIQKIVLIDSNLFRKIASYFKLYDYRKIR